MATAMPMAAAMVLHPTTVNRSTSSTARATVSRVASTLLGSILAVVRFPVTHFDTHLLSWTVLLAMDRKSPQFAGSQRNPKVQGDGLPELQSFSDVAWLKWKAVIGDTPSSMRYFASLSITNLETRGIFSKVLDKAKFTEVPAWPGHDVDANTEDGAALLGKSVTWSAQQSSDCESKDQTFFQRCQRALRIVRYFEPHADYL